MKDVVVYHPQNFDELDDIVNETNIRAVFVAGATDLMVREDNWRSADAFIDLSAITDMTGLISFNHNEVRIGAGVPLINLIRYKKLAAAFPMLVEACRQIGSVQIQNRATLGGNIANASPAGDTLPVLAVYDARLLVGPRRNGSFQSLAIDEVMLGPGQTILEGNRYIAVVVLPKPAPESFWYFRKVGPRHAMAISKVSLAVYGLMKGEKITDIRIAAGSVTPKIQRAKQTEAVLRGKRLTDGLIKKAGEQILNEIDPITDIRSTREYRRRTCRALLIEALTHIRQR